MVYLLCSILVIAISFVLFRKVSGSMRLTELNLISFSYYYRLIIQSFIGVNIVIFGLDNHYLLNRITDISIKESTYLSVCFVLLLMPLSMLFISYIFKFNAYKEWNHYKHKKIQGIISRDDKAIFITLVLFTLVSLFSIVYTFFTIKTIPVLNLFSGSSGEESARLRILSSWEFGGIVYIRNIFGLTLTPILSYIAFSYSKKSKYVGWRVLFWILFTLSVSILTYSLAKGPVLFYILSFLILNIYINGKINLRKFIRYIIVISILIVIFYLLLSTNINFLDINSGPLGRILLGQIAGLYFHFTIFPDILPFLQGQSFPSFILKLFDIESVRSARLVMEYVNPYGVEQGIAGVMNSLFIAEAYANFGWLGIIFGTILVGFFIQLLYIIFIRIPKNPITIALFTEFTISLPLTGGFFDFLYNPNMLITIILMCLFYIIALVINKLFIYTRNEVLPYKEVNS